MPHLKKKIIDEIIEIEGGYVNDPSDSGGETNWGITVAVARAYGYYGDMKDLPRETAFDIYADRYWDSLHLDEIAVRSKSIAEELADTGVNMGVYRAGVFLQTALNALNNQEKYYDDLTVDGRVGRITIAAFRRYLDVRGTRGEVVLHRALNCQQGAFYIELTKRREKDEKFLFGWLLNRVV